MIGSPSKLLVRAFAVGLVSLVVVVGSLRGQQAASSAHAVDRNPPAHWQMEARVAAEISRENPEVSKKTLRQDGHAIQSAYPHILNAFTRKGFTNSEVDEVVAFGWKDFRRRQPGGEFTPGDFMLRAERDFGGLKVVSEPPGATVLVDGRAWTKKTNCQDVTHAGLRKIVLTKAGYEKKEAYKDIVAGQWNTFLAVLKKK